MRAIYADELQHVSGGEGYPGGGNERPSGTPAPLSDGRPGVGSKIERIVTVVFLAYEIIKEGYTLVTKPSDPNAPPKEPPPHQPSPEENNGSQP